MRVLKGSGTYLERQSQSHKKISTILFVIGGLGIAFSLISLAFVLIFIFIPFLGIGGFFLRKATYYNRGLWAEKAIIKRLQSLDDQYLLMNDITIPNSYGNIDHLLLGPNGIFVIETKNLEGSIRCDGDAWYQYKEEWKLPVEHEIRSPSKQVKAAAVRVKRILEAKNIISRPIKLWVNGVIVFTNNKLTLKVQNATVPILKLDTLLPYIKDKKADFIFSSRELDAISQAILKLEEQ